MKTAFFIILSCFLSTVVKAQSSVNGIHDISLPIKNSGVLIDSFKITKPETAYDLALNLSYLNHVSEGLTEKFLVLPVVTIENIPVDETQLKAISINEVADYKFEAGVLTQALYGSRGQCGHLEIKKGRRLQRPVIKN